MFVKDVQLFKGLDPGFINELANCVQEVSFTEDHVVVRRGEAADNLFIMLEGRVSLSIGEGGSINFLIDSPGEIFGWSALVEPNTYTATATCYQACKLLMLDRVQTEHILDKHPQEAYLIMKRLAGVIGQRLVHTYEESLHSLTQDKTPSYG